MSTTIPGNRGLAASLALGLLVGASLAPAPSAAQDLPHVSYETPARSSLLPVERFLRAGRSLERIRQAALLTRLPAGLRYRAGNCGRADAWYAPDMRTVTLCYEYVEELWGELHPRGTADAIELRSLQGYVDLTLLHETAHAFFDLLHVPVLGREEDAADQLATLILLKLPPEEARTSIGQVVATMKAITGTGELTIEDVADDHSLTSQRLHNIVCLAYGRHHRSYRPLALEIHMPPWRRRACRSEYRQVANAFRKLIGPHVIGERNAISAFRRIYGRKAVALPIEELGLKTSTNMGRR